MVGCRVGWGEATARRKYRKGWGDADGYQGTPKLVETGKGRQRFGGFATRNVVFITEAIDFRSYRVFGGATTE